VTNNGVTVRQATIQDIPRLVPVFDCYREHFGQQKNSSAAAKFLFEKFEHRESVIFIAEEQNEIIGFAQLYPTFSSLTLQRVWILNDFFISGQYRQRRIGEQLFSAVKEFSLVTRAKGIELTAQHTNNKAWQFWERQGFILDEEFRSYFLKQ